MSKYIVTIVSRSRYPQNRHRGQIDRLIAAVSEAGIGNMARDDDEGRRKNELVLSADIGPGQEDNFEKVVCRELNASDGASCANRPAKRTNGVRQVFITKVA